MWYSTTLNVLWYGTTLYVLWYHILCGGTFNVLWSVVPHLMYCGMVPHFMYCGLGTVPHLMYCGWYGTPLYVLWYTLWTVVCGYHTTLYVLWVVWYQT